MEIGTFVVLQLCVFTLHLMIALAKLALFVCRVLLELAFKLRMLPCVIYAAVVAVRFEPWAQAHTVLALGILIGLAVLALVSWIVTLVFWLKRRKLEDQIALENMERNAIHLSYDDLLRKG